MKFDGLGIYLVVMRLSVRSSPQGPSQRHRRFAVQPRRMLEDDNEAKGSFWNPAKRIVELYHRQLAILRANVADSSGINLRDHRMLGDVLSCS